MIPFHFLPTPIYFLCALLPGVVGCASPQASRSNTSTTIPRLGGIDLHDKIRQVYNFEPHSLDQKQIEEESGKLDKFWEEATHQSAAYAAALRKELADFSNPPFFLFDGSRLLLSLSSDAADRRIILAAVARCDLRDMHDTDYFRLVHRMAAQGEDTTAAAFHILEKPNFTVFVPQHALTLGQTYALAYLLYPTNPDFWLNRAISRLRSETDATAQRSLLMVLFYAQTPEADKAVLEFSRDASKPASSRSIAAKTIGGKSKDFMAKLAGSLTSEQSLRQARRECMKSVSDEALYEFERDTAKIIAKRK